MFWLAVIFACVALWGQEFKTTAKVTEPVARLGGGVIAKGDYPHQVAIFHRNNYWCGGSILSRKIVISAAHCFEEGNLTRFKVVAGTKSLTGKSIEIPVDRIIMHEKFDTKNLDYDVAIIVLKNSFKFQENIQPIALARTPAPIGTEIKVIGWGKLFEDSPVSNYLREINIFVVDIQSCQNDYTNITLTDRMFCAEAEDGRKSSCKGDSGGPAIFQNKLVGIVSGAFGCGVKASPTTFASVPRLYNWITKTVIANDWNSMEYISP